MKKAIFSLITLLVSPTFAADLPMQNHAMITQEANPAWSGAYVGINAGGIFGSGDSSKIQTWNTFPDSAFESINLNNIQASALLTNALPANTSVGFIGGGQIGYNWHVRVQSIGLVAGAEADIQGTAGQGISSSRWIGAPGASFVAASSFYGIGNITAQTISMGLNYLGTVRGRLGLLLYPEFLAFVTAGLGYGSTTLNLDNYQALLITSSNVSGINTGQFGLVNGSGHFSGMSAGWVAGGGVEWLLASNWSIKAEYLYFDLGQRTGSLTNIFYSTLGGPSSLQSITSYSYNQNGNIARVGLNYHFQIVDSKTSMSN
jgi:outer membrane immunogenic protein